MVKVFVYGTLLSGFGNNCLLKGQEYLGPAKTRPEFTFLNVGGFPGLVEGGETAILGEVYEIDEDCLKDLDCLEGCYPNTPDKGLYRRLSIILEDGREVVTYCFNRRGSRRDEIKSGNWREFDSERRYSYCG